MGKSKRRRRRVASLLQPVFNSFSLSLVVVAGRWIFARRPKGEREGNLPPSFSENSKCVLPRGSSAGLVAGKKAFERRRS